MDNTRIEDSATISPTRRRVVKGAAWSLPVIAVAVAAPAASASGTVVPEQYTFAGGTDTVTVGGVIKDVKLTGGNFTLTGPAGISTGELSLLVTFPDGYTEWSPVAELYSWTWEERMAGNKKVLRFTHPGFSITSGATSGSAWFAGIVLHGSGASQWNSATFSFRCANYTGGGLFAPEQEW